MQNVKQLKITDARRAKSIKFAMPQASRFVKFIAVSSFDPSKPYASLAEFNVIKAGE